MKPKIIAQGAEALIVRKGNSVLKDRIKKSYRIKELDEKLRKQRTKKEAKLLQKALTIIPVPKILSIRDYRIELELLKGRKLSEHLDKLKNANQICRQIGINISKLHDINIIHGDLTTSNMIYVEDNSKNKKDIADIKKISIVNLNASANDKDRKEWNELSVLRDSKRESNRQIKVFFIDFGLGFESNRIEDKAVDLHLIKQALEAKHFRYFKSFFDSVLKGYRISKNSPAVLNQLKKVKSRGRYKEQY